MRRTIHTQFRSALLVTSITYVTPSIFWVDVMDYQCGQVSPLTNAILGTRAKTEFSFPPLQRNTRFRKLTAEGHTVALVSIKVFQLFGENDRRS